jgi:DNA-directed RNA polymerase subunit RPC12/RpoP
MGGDRHDGRISTADRAYPEGMDTVESIICVECGARAHRLSHPPPDEGDRPGDVVAYVCSECSARFDIELEQDPEAPPYEGPIR